MHQSAPLVGVGVILLRDGHVLLGQRQGSHGAGTWAPPGGHLEFGETVDDCAQRELAEETGLSVHAFTPGPYTSDVFEAEGKHYVTLFVMAQCPDGEPQILEPEKCSQWAWFSWSQLPSPLFAPLQTLQQSGFDPASQDVRR